MKARRLLRQFRRFHRATEAVSAPAYAILVGVVSIAVGAAMDTNGGGLGGTVGGATPAPAPTT